MVAVGSHATHRPRSRQVSRWGAHAVATGLVVGAFLLSTTIRVDDIGLTIARSVHVVSLVLAFGPVILLDWYGLAWLTGRRRFGDVRQLADAADPLIWLGISSLALSGVFLAPDLHHPLALIKAGFVLVLVNNGVAVRSLAERLRAVGDPVGLRALPPALRRRLLSSIVISQSAWWGAVIIGLVTSDTRVGG